jgi:hypothetical protein
VRVARDLRLIDGDLAGAFRIEGHAHAQHRHVHEKREGLGEVEGDVFGRHEGAVVERRGQGSFKLRQWFHWIV